MTLGLWIEHSFLMQHWHSLPCEKVVARFDGNIEVSWNDAWEQKDDTCGLLTSHSTHMSVRSLAFGRVSAWSVRTPLFLQMCCHIQKWPSTASSIGSLELLCHLASWGRDDDYGWGQQSVGPRTIVLGTEVISLLRTSKCLGRVKCSHVTSKEARPEMKTHRKFRHFCWYRNECGHIADATWNEKGTSPKHSLWLFRMQASPEKVWKYLPYFRIIRERRNR